MNVHRPLALLALALFLACSKPAPPQITPKSISVTSVSNIGINLDAKIAAFNPNGFDLSAKSVNARLILDGSVDVGSVNVDTPLSLPSKGTAELDVPLSIRWKSLGSLLPLAQKPSVPYAVDGIVVVGGKLSVDVPFHLEGTLAREQIGRIVSLGFPRPM